MAADPADRRPATPSTPASTPPRPGLPGPAGAPARPALPGAPAAGLPARPGAALPARPLPGAAPSSLAAPRTAPAPGAMPAAPGARPPLGTAPGAPSRLAGAAPSTARPAPPGAPARPGLPGTTAARPALPGAAARTGLPGTTAARPPLSAATGTTRPGLPAAGTPAGAARPGLPAAGAPTTALERLAARQAAAGASPTPPGARPAATPPSTPSVRPSALPRPGGGIAAPAPRFGAGASATTPAPARPAAPRPGLATASPSTAAGATPITGRLPISAAQAASARPVAGSTPAPATPRRVPLTPMPLPTPAEIEATVDHEAYERFAVGIKALLGFDLNQYKRPQVWRRSNSFAKQKGCADVHELVERCKTDLELRTAVRDMITINVSEFFRNPEAWESLRNLVLPELTRLGRPIRMWSAGCSLGYEPYTFAMLVKESGSGADAKILATDLDETILAQARASAYAEHQMVGMSPARRAKWFDERDGLAVVKAELRGMITWRRQDLLRDPFPSDQDLIACRNVVIYFTDEAKDALYKRFAQALRPGGILFIGATEAISAPRDFGLQMLTSGIYRRVG